MAAADDVFGLVGTVIAGAFHVEDVVAEGGFAVVYRAYHAGFRAPVALKCLKIPQQFTRISRDDFLEQFRAEAELLFRLSASIPTVVRPLHVDAITSADQFIPYMALEWLEGENLDAIVQRRKAAGRQPMPLKKLVRLLTPVARALERAHNFVGPDGSISIVHRDLKPENIFIADVAGEQVVKVLDFGIAKAKSVASQVAGRASQTHRGLSSFTPAYGAPEQWVPKRYGQTGPWTDVWGLALTLVEVLAARPIIDGDNAAMMGTTLDENRRPTPRNEGVEVSDEVESVFARALAVDPRDRYQDAGLFWDDLMNAVGLEAETVDTGTRRRDMRQEGVAPRVEQIEAAMPAHVRRPSPPAGREAPTEAAVESALPDPEWRVAEQFRVHQSAPPPAASSGGSGQLAAVPDLEIGPPSGPISSGPPPSAQPGSQRAAPAASAPAIPVPAHPAEARSSGANIELEASGGLDLALDLEPGERPQQRSQPEGLRRSVSSGTMAAVRSQPPVNASYPPLRVQPSTESASTPIAKRLAPGIALMAAGVLITVGARLYSIDQKDPVAVGWIAGPLVIAGIGLIIYRLMPRGG